MIATVRWSTLKYSAMNSDYKLKPWFKHLEADEKELLEQLRVAQRRVARLGNLKQAERYVELSPRHVNFESPNFK